MRFQRALALLVLASGGPVHGAVAQGPVARVTGSITDATSRRPLEGVSVWFADTLTGVTNKRGDFQIKDVPWGLYQVRLSRIGYRTKSLEVAVAGDERGVYVVAALEPVPVELEPIVVRGDTTTIVAYGRMSDFFRRRRLGFGRFFTRQDIERRHPFRVSDLLWGIPGARVRYDEFGDPVFYFRNSAGLSRPCPPAIYLNHMRVPSDFGVVDAWVWPDEVAGMEVYSGFGTTPAEFYGGCGAIVIWTR